MTVAVLIRPEDKLSNKLISEMLVIESVMTILVPKLMIPCELYAVFSRDTGPEISVTEFALIVPEVYPSRAIKSVTDTELSVMTIFSLFYCMRLFLDNACWRFINFEENLIL